MSKNPVNSWIERLSGDIAIRPNDHRDPYQRDKARILHSAAFRRLQSKTQILGVGTDDFYRTRLTHSLEVAQIGSGIMAQLRQLPEVEKSKTLQKLISSDALIEALCLAHDIGHPPFGHGGEVALNYKMKNHGGFEANGQTFRIVTRLEPYTKDNGMDLTRRTILGLIKYPQVIKENPDHQQSETIPRYIEAEKYKPVKGLFEDDLPRFEWVLRPMDKDDRSLFTETIALPTSTQHEFLNTKTPFESFDASIMELADDIAYGVHDLEDAIVLGKVSKAQWFELVLPRLLEIENPWANKHSTNLSTMLFSNEHHERKNAIGALVNHLITNVRLVQNENFKSPLLAFNAQLTDAASPILIALKQFVFNFVIKDTQLQRLEFKGQNMLNEMFDAFCCDPKRLLPADIYARFEDTGAHRTICDYIANMSDSQAKRTHLQLFS